MKYSVFIFLSVLLFSGCRSSILDDPATIINFSIPQPSHVKLTIENSYNTVVAVLIDQDLESGVYSVNFNSDNLAEGVYFYKVVAKGIGNDYYFESEEILLLVK